MYLHPSQNSFNIQDRGGVSSGIVPGGLAHGVGVCGDEFSRVDGVEGTSSMSSSSSEGSHLPEDRGGDCATQSLSRLYVSENDSLGVPHPVNDMQAIFWGYARERAPNACINMAVHVFSRIEPQDRRMHIDTLNYQLLEDPLRAGTFQMTDAQVCVFLCVCVCL